MMKEAIDLGGRFVNDGTPILITGPAFSGKERYAELLSRLYGYRVPDIVCLNRTFDVWPYNIEVTKYVWNTKTSLGDIVGVWSDTSHTKFGYDFSVIENLNDSVVLFGDHRSWKELCQISERLIQRVHVDPTVDTLLRNMSTTGMFAESVFEWVVEGSVLKSDWDRCDESVIVVDGCQRSYSPRDRKED